MGQYEKVDWQPLEQITSAKLQKMADNDDYFDQRKTDGAIRNIGPDRVARGALPNIQDNLAIYAEYREISPGKSFPDDNDHRKNISPSFTKHIVFPTGFFDPEFLPVVIASIGVKNGIHEVIYSLKDLTSAGFRIQIREVTRRNFTESMNYFVSYIAIGVKGG